MCCSNEVTLQNNLFCKNILVLTICFKILSTTTVYRLQTEKLSEKKTLFMDLPSNIITLQWSESGHLNRKNVTKIYIKSI